MAALLHPSQLTDAALLGECVVRRQRRSGPGGQHRNKVSTAVILIHEPTGVQAEASERRSQPENLKVAIGRLRVRLALVVRSSPTDIPQNPSERWRSRIRCEQIIVSVSHADFPALLAEALDAVTTCNFDHKAAATQLGCSASQLVKFLKQEPLALQTVNAQRQEKNLKPLR